MPAAHKNTVPTPQRATAAKPPRVPGCGLAPLAPDGLPIDQPPVQAPGSTAPLMIRLLAFMLVFAAVGGLGTGLSYLIDSTGPANGTGMLVTALSLIIAALSAYLMVVIKLEHRHPVEFDPRRSTGLIGGIALGSGLVLAAATITWALGGLVIHGHRPASDIPWISEVIMTGIFAGVVEEILFRGLAFRLIEQYLGSWTAVGASALIFGCLHIFAAEATWISAAATIVEAGLLLAMVYLLTRSLWWVIGLHTAWNVVLSNGLGIPVSGNVNEGLLITQSSGSDLISGGTYGLESSLVTVVLLTAVAVTGLYVAHRRGLMVPYTTIRQARRDTRHA